MYPDGDDFALRFRILVRLSLFRFIRVIVLAYSDLSERRPG